MLAKACQLGPMIGLAGENRLALAFAVFKSRYNHGLRWLERLL